MCFQFLPLAICIIVDLVTPNTLAALPESQRPSGIDALIILTATSFNLSDPAAYLSVIPGMHFRTTPFGTPRPRTMDCSAVTLVAAIIGLYLGLPISLPGNQI